MAPATNGNFLKNNYILDVNVKYGGLSCFSAKPAISIPLTVIPQIDPNVFGFPEPPGFQPIDLGMFKVNLEDIGLTHQYNAPPMNYIAPPPEMCMQP